jgi:alkylation response protein AidB-like acyl-CoA dehydrogenase
VPKTCRAGAQDLFAISEPSGGADPARAIRTRAERKGDRYVLNGSKMWITGAEGADWGIVFARTGEQGDRGGITGLHRRRPAIGHEPEADPGDPLLRAVRDAPSRTSKCRSKTAWATKARASHLPRNG